MAVGEEAAGAGGGPSSSGGPRQVTPLQAGLAGGGALSVGALLGGVGYYTTTAKALAEEGIDPRAKALAAATGVCVALGAAGAAAWRLAGLRYQSVAEVSSLQDAVILAQQQREVLAREFRGALERGNGAAGGAAGGAGEAAAAGAGHEP
eukprot:scaffold2.g7388.t1